MESFGWTPSEGELQVEACLAPTDYKHGECQDLMAVLDQEVKGAATFNEFVWLMRL